ncbi:c-type cytochrome [Rheinheimera salexigens]|uniref:Cytochrome C556 n=1 Tax=Rheinheimera salexigens TaxID=1628148 RepID=A0A1E7Q515_9GAMM|nr:cytochrome c [Rheinheimera salexigens]OEY69249.1 cytochrome C556 [Rheinheimera salexigens]
MKKSLIAALVLAISSPAVIAASVFSDAKDSVEYRQAAFQLIRHNMADIGDMVKGDVTYDADRVKERATALATLTTLPWYGFSVKGGDAKAEIWDNLADFKSRGEKLASDAAVLHTASLNGDQAEIRKAFGTFARNCKACHDKYKE